ncbi:MAG TPA: hypothetical protein VG963_28635 [Polyangiaceae bacterium]|nr:hypothetical protein [Steroidobacteraceae bacterium]HVZ36443.1 hypothetical protein [Polyangiaceae bacterium]
MTTHELRHFLLLDAEAQKQAIRRLAALGYGDHDIARMTGWHVAEVRRVLSEQEIRRA